MDSILDLLSIGAATVSGGVFGLLGTAFGAWMKNKERAQKALDQQAERDHQVRMVELQMTANNQGASWDAMTTTHQSEIALNQQDNYKWVLAIKSLFRPGLTLFLWLAVGWQINLILMGSLNHYLDLASNNQTLFTAPELIALVKYVLYSTVFSATTSTTWWFGERALSLPEMKNK